MLRVNLAMGRRELAVARDTTQLAVGLAGSLLVLGMGLTLLHGRGIGQLRRVQADSRSLAADIAALKAGIGDYDKVLAQRAHIQKLKASVAALEAKRSGPLMLMQELSNVLTPGKGPTVDEAEYKALVAENPRLDCRFTPWDGRNVWLENVSSDSSRVTISGSARSNEDVAELMRRMQVSVMFTDVTLHQTNAQGGDRELRHVRFGLTAGIRGR